ncbi:MAG: hypothetical protein ACTSRU_19490 [Candidatus Hodarchaeales archaeon]
MSRYILLDYFYEPPEEIVFRNKNEVIEYLLERIGDVGMRVER